MITPESAYRTAIELDPDAAEAYRGLGEAKLQLAEHRDAGQAFLQYLKLRPDAPDRALVLSDLRSIAEILKAEQETNDEN